MKILYYDCFCGISGDMNLGALLDVGVDSGYLLHELGKLGLAGEFRLEIRKDSKNGIAGTKADVVLLNGHGHQHRHLSDIESTITGSGLGGRVKERSLAIFRKLAEAEAKIHGTSVEEVHFHEVGGIDAIVDIVGAAIAMEYLKVDRVFASPVQVGGGFVTCAHGILPVPAPAVAEILKGVPVRTGLVPFETTTPTGAAILTCFAEKFIDRTGIRIEKIGYGLGSRDLEVPNVLRVYLGSMDEPQGAGELWMLETNIDDMNPELYGYAEQLLFAGGALDVWKTPVMMKKGRPAVQLSVLAGEKDLDRLEEVVFHETTSLGVRKYSVGRTMLRREVLTVSTRWGEVRVKLSYYEGKPLKYKAEYEDCKKLAEENHIPLVEVYREVDRAAESLAGWKSADGKNNPDTKG